MGSRSHALRRACLVAVFPLAASSCFAASAPAQPLTTALMALPAFTGSEAPLAFARASASGARALRVDVSWRSTAPGGDTSPPGFDATNPFDSHYDWRATDQLVRQTLAAGLSPILSVRSAPDWAEGSGSGAPGTVAPDPSAFAQFMLAVARRYNGEHPDLPRVYLYEEWNEPNAAFFLNPQFDDSGRAVSVDRYRDMVNLATAAVHSVHADNVVVAGTAFSVTLPDHLAVGAMRFLRELMCLSAGPRPRPVCSQRIAFDVWAVNPYTGGNAFHQSGTPDGAVMGDLPAMRDLLAAGQRTGQLVHSGPVGFWVTEMSWDTNPPDPGGVPLDLHARWTSEALYQAWRSGVSLFTWFQLGDDPMSGPGASMFQAGLYLDCGGALACEQPKPALTAFRFPFVAYLTRHRPPAKKPAKRSLRRSTRRRPAKAKAKPVVLVWGRTPPGAGGRVRVEQLVGASWRLLASLKPDASGIFKARVVAAGGGDVRARTASDASLPFSLTVPPDRPSTNPFGANAQ